MPVNSESKNFCVYFGPGFYLIPANSVGELKEMFSSNSYADNSKGIFRHDLSKHKVAIAREYNGHDLADFEGEKAELLLPDDHVPTPNGQIVYLVVSPPIDFEAYREMLYADIRADNARRKAEEEAAAEAKAKASSSA